MATRTIWAGLVVSLVLTGCGTREGDDDGHAQVAVATPTTGGIATIPIVPASAVPATDRWLGKWVGVEGLALTIARGDRPGTYRLHIALMDGADDYVGTAAGDTIRFERDGKAETIRATDGDATGLKWLAGKPNCLTIKPGEGFCRG